MGSDIEIEEEYEEEDVDWEARAEEEVLDALENSEDEYEELEDNFMEIANEGEFATVMEEYNEDAIGELEPTGQSLYSETELNSMMDQFIQENPTLFNKQSDLTKLNKKKIAKIDPEEDHVMQAVLEAKDPDVEKMFSRELVEKEPEYDVESVASTYTNTDNRPAIIAIEGPKKRNKKQKPLEDVKEEEEKPSAHTVRVKGETGEERKKRKAAIREEKRERKTVKKNMKRLFQFEKAKLDERAAGKYDIREGVRVLRL